MDRKRLEEIKEWVRANANQSGHPELGEEIIEVLEEQVSLQEDMDEISKYLDGPGLDLDL